VLFIKYYLGDQINENQISGICGTYREEEKSILCFGEETQRNDHVEGLGFAIHM
jgi:hypothetical protein